MLEARRCWTKTLRSMRDPKTGRYPSRASMIAGREELSSGDDVSVDERKCEA